MNSVDKLEYNERINKYGSVFLLTVLFLVFPFLAFIYSLFRFDQKSSRIIIILFISLFGYNMVAESSEMDLYRYHGMLQQYSYQSVGGIIDSFFSLPKEETSVWDTDNSYIDIYVSVVCAILSRITDDGNILMGCFGLVYGIAMVKVLEQFLDKDSKMGLYTFILIFCASFAIPLYTLAGVRHGTATFFFVWAVVANMNKEQVKSYILLFMACITHFVFVLPTILFFIYIIVIKYTPFLRYPLWGLYILSFLLPDVTSAYVENALPFLSSSLFDRASLYNNPDSIESLSNAYFVDTNLFVRLRDDLVYWFSFIGMLLLRSKMFSLSFSERSEKLYFWVILFMTLTNFSLSIPDLGIRLKFVSFLFFFFYLSQVYNENKENTKLRYFIVLALLFSMLKIVVESRIIIEYTTLTLLVGNLYYILIDNSNVSVWTLLKNR